MKVCIIDPCFGAKARYEGIKKVKMENYVLTLISKHREVFKFDRPHLIDYEIEEDEEE